MTNDQIRGNILLGEPVHVERLGDIYAPTVKNILAIGVSKLYEYLHILSTDISDIGTHEELKEISNFELIYFDPIYKKRIIQAIAFFTQKDAFFIEEHGFIGVESGRIDKENYDEFVRVVKVMCDFKKPKPNKETEGMTQEQRAVYEKIMMYRRKKSTKDEMSLYDIILLVKLGTEHHITSCELKKMSYFELKRRLDVLRLKERSSTFLQYKTSMKFDVKDEEPHWMDALKNIYKESAKE